MSSDDGWVQWNTDFELPKTMLGYKYVFIYFKGPKRQIDIVLDDLHLIEVYQDPQWKAKTDLLIDRHRKRDVVVRYVSS